MKKFIKGNVKVFVAVIITAVICICGTVYAASQILASDISYRNGTVESALNDLYDKANSSTGLVCMKLSGTTNQVGAKYHCDLGDGELRNFYVLKVGTDDVELIMERNISDTVGSSTTMSWNDATSFFDEGHDGYSLKQTWLTKVKEVKLPDAQTIVNAGGITGFDVTQHVDLVYVYFGTNSQSDYSKRNNYLWLWDYTRECPNCSNSLSSSYAYGYWTSSKTVENSSSNAWNVHYIGCLNSSYALTDDTHIGVRPVITVAKSKLAG